MSQRSNECFNCGKSGHFSRDCTESKKSGSGPRSGACYKCGESGHISRDCSQNDSQGDRRGGYERRDDRRGTKLYLNFY